MLSDVESQLKTDGKWGPSSSIAGSFVAFTRTLSTSACAALYSPKTDRMRENHLSSHGSPFELVTLCKNVSTRPAT